MTLVYNQVVVEIGDRQTRQLSHHEMNRIVNDMDKMFGMVEHNPQSAQFYLDRYCQRKGIKPLLITDILL